MKKRKRFNLIIEIVALCVIITSVSFFTTSNIEHRTWVLFYAQQAEAPHFVVAHGKDYDVSNIEDPLFSFSKLIELTCEAKDGKLLLTDKTNGKTYEGTYIMTSGWLGRFSASAKKSYSVIIDGLEGTANFSSNKTLFVSIGGYYLNFEIE